MMNSTETTTYRDRTAVMVECDALDDEGRLSDQVTLTRLHDAIQRGECLDDYARATIGELSSKLGIQQTKKVGVSQDILARRGIRQAHGTIFLSEPLGPYHTKISLSFNFYTSPEVCKAWDENPIEACEITMIPGGVSVDNFRSHRLNRCISVSLHWAQPVFSEAFSLLMSLNLENCRVLELRNLQMNESKAKVLKQRLKWPRLANILYKG